MNLTIKKAALIKIIKFLKWGKVTAKFAAIGTTVIGAMTALYGSVTTGVALSAGGATAYAVAKGVPTQGYEKTKHVPPGRIDKAGNLRRRHEIESLVGGKGRSGPLTGISPQSAMRGPMKASSFGGTMPRKK